MIILGGGDFLLFYDFTQNIYAIYNIGTEPTLYGEGKKCL